MLTITVLEHTWNDEALATRKVMGLVGLHFIRFLLIYVCPSQYARDPERLLIKTECNKVKDALKITFAYLGYLFSNLKTHLLFSGPE